MAKKITELPDLPTPAASDIIPLVDVSGSLTSRTTVAAVAAQIPADTVTNAMLADGAGEPGGAWDTWTSTLTNLTIGNGTVSAKYKKVGRTVDFTLSINAGTTTSITGSFSFSLPVTAASITATKNFIASGRMEDSGVNGYIIFSELTTTTTSAVFVVGAGGSYANIAALTGTVPYNSFGNGDSIFLSGSYEAAA
jgi:hypothetical protein